MHLIKVEPINSGLLMLLLKPLAKGVLTDMGHIRVIMSVLVIRGFQ